MFPIFPIDFRVIYATQSPHQHKKPDYTNPAGQSNLNFIETRSDDIGWRTSGIAKIELNSVLLCICVRSAAKFGHIHTVATIIVLHYIHIGINQQQSSAFRLIEVFI